MRILKNANKHRWATPQTSTEWDFMLPEILCVPKGWVFVDNLIISHRIAGPGCGLPSWIGVIIAEKLLSISYFWLIVDGPSVFRAIWIITSCSIGSGTILFEMNSSAQFHDLLRSNSLGVGWGAQYWGFENDRPTTFNFSEAIWYYALFAEFSTLPVSLKQFFLNIWIYQIIWISHSNVVFRAVICWFAARYLNFLIILVFQYSKIVSKQYIEQFDIVIVILQYG